MGDSQDLGLKQAWKEKLVVLWVEIPCDGQKDGAPVHPLAPLWGILRENYIWELGLSCLGFAGGGCTRCSDPLFLISY